MSATNSPMKKVFRPKLLPTLVMLVVVGVTCTAGVWQSKRYQEQKANVAWYHQQYDVLPPVSALGTTAQAANRLEQLHYRRAALTGKLDMADVQLLTARIGAGNRLGYDVIVPVELPDGKYPRLLTNLGWAPPDKLPGWLAQLRAHDAPVTLTGRLRRSDVQVSDARPVGSFAGLKTWMHPIPATLAKSIAGLDPELLLEVGEQASGKVVDVEAVPQAIYDYPVHPEPQQNFSYALQWFGMALTAVAVWVALSREDVAG